MRAREILEENYDQSLQSDLENLLVGAKGAGAQEIRTQDLVDQLAGMGYTVNNNSIMTLLSANPIVLNATGDMIQLTRPESSQGSAAEVDDSAARVKDMAAKATKI